MTDDPVLASSDSTFSIQVPGYHAQEGERMSFRVGTRHARRTFRPCSFRRS